MELPRYEIFILSDLQSGTDVMKYCKPEDVEKLEQSFEASKRQMEEYAELNNGLQAINEMYRKKIEILERIIDDQNKAEAMKQPQIIERYDGQHCKKETK
jgi:hypothetical protein